MSSGRLDWGASLRWIVHQQTAEENENDLRLLARSSRRCRPAELLDLCPAAARAILVAPKSPLPISSGKPT
jgi:hypothetical protein